MTIFELIESELSKISKFYDDFEKEPSHTDIVLGPLNEREHKLYTLAHEYRKKYKQIKATMILLEKKESSEWNELQERKIYFENLKDLISDSMWLEIRIRFSDKLKQIKNYGIGLRKNGVCVIITKPPLLPSLAELFRLPFEE